MSAFAASHPTKLTTARTYSLSRRRQLCAIAEIQSSKNPRVKFARALLLRRQREKTDKILLEGQRLIKDALEAGTKPHSLFYTLQAMENETTNKVIHQNMKQQGADNVCVSDNVLASISDTIHPQGLVGIFEKPKTDIQTNLPTFVLICDQVSDPGNLGSLLRSASGAGVEVVLLTTGCADVWSLKTLRAGMGAQFRLPLLANMTWEEIESSCKQWNLDVHVADADAPIFYSEIDWCTSRGLVIGSEAHGPSDEAFEIGTPVSIPMKQNVESLNAAMAGTVILFEAARQRSLLQ